MSNYYAAAKALIALETAPAGTPIELLAGHIKDIRDYLDELPSLIVTTPRDDAERHAANTATVLIGAAGVAPSNYVFPVNGTAIRQESVREDWASKQVQSVLSRSGAPSA